MNDNSIIETNGQCVYEDPQPIINHDDCISCDRTEQIANNNNSGETETINSHD